MGLLLCFLQRLEDCQMPMIDMVKKAFNAQRAQARQRGIEFQFDYWAWTNWWEEQLGPDWFKKRGNIKGKFVMARYGDEGPYKPANVKCITFETNSLDKVPNGKTTFGAKHPMVKLSEIEALSIKRSKESIKTLVERFGVTRTTIQDIRKGRRWKHLPL